MAQADRDSITRRSLISGAMALVPATTLPAPAAAPPARTTAAPAADPIFAAIEAHRRAYDGIVAIVDLLADAEDAVHNAKRGTRRAAKQHLAAIYAEDGRLGRIEREAAERFVATIPQTLHGAAAALRYVRERFDEGYPMCEEDGYMTLLASIEQAICRAAGVEMQAEVRRAS